MDIKIEDLIYAFKKEGCFIGEDGHIYNKEGKLKSRMMKNGYYTIRKMINGITKCYMEHRVIWVWYYGWIDDDLEINHKDFDRTNNKLENLELVTRQQNVDHARERLLKNVKRGHESYKSILTEKEVQLIRFLNEKGYKQKEVAELFGLKHYNMISRVVTKARYGNVEKAADFMSIFPVFVDKLRNREGGKIEELKNYAMGLSGEVGETVDILKKYLFHGHELKESELVLELGDVLFYITAICNVLDIDFYELHINNMEKLQKRYPDGFSKESSVNRKDGR